ncbi:MAG: DUF721 domain-containing protein [Candidatus Omnitrophica bacterium]|nr:DUF721 domain-containing protein [Candidatus Omnitrophota bacterium]
MTTHIKNLLQSFFQDKSARMQERDGIEAVKKRVLGEYLNEHVRIDDISNGKVIFSVPTSHFRYEVSLRRQQLCDEIQKIYPEIKKILVRVG